MIGETVHLILVTAIDDANCHHYMHSFVETSILSNGVRREEESSFDVEILLVQIGVTVRGEETEVDCNLECGVEDYGHGLWGTGNVFLEATVVCHLFWVSSVLRETGYGPERDHHGLWEAANEILGGSQVMDCLSELLYLWEECMSRCLLCLFLDLVDLVDLVHVEVLVLVLAGSNSMCLYSHGEVGMGPVQSVRQVYSFLRHQSIRHYRLWAPRARAHDRLWQMSVGAQGCCHVLHTAGNCRPYSQI